MPTKWLIQIPVAASLGILLGYVVALMLFRVREAVGGMGAGVSADSAGRALAGTSGSGQNEPSPAAAPAPISATVREAERAVIAAADRWRGPSAKLEDEYALIAAIDRLRAALAEEGA